MCEFDGDGEEAKIWNEEEITAAKEHRCSGCREPIRKGHKYRRTTVLGDSWNTWKHCQRCATLVDVLKKSMGREGYTTELLDLNCGETWVDVPPELADLAFALPGEVPPEIEIDMIPRRITVPSGLRRLSQRDAAKSDHGP